MKKLRQKDSFGLAAKEYQRYRRSYDAKLYDLIFSLIPEKKPKILDIGCGTGKSTEPLVTSSRGREISVTGIDPDEAMLREARLSAKKKGLNIEYIQGTAEKIHFAGNSFDAVIAGAAFHWFGNKRAVAKIKTVLKDSSVFVIFWAQYVKSNKPTIGAALYEKYGWKGIPKKFRGQDFVCKLLRESGFKKVTKTMIPFSEKATISQSIGNLKTNSSYILMSPSTKEKFVKEMTQAYKTAYGTEKFKINNLELRVCYGFK